MKTAILILALLAILAGCSSGGIVVPSNQSEELTTQIASSQPARWTWSSGLYHVSEDHTSIERIQNRIADWHLNVTPFVEPPICNHCLMIGKPQIQPDSTMKVKVILTHPFPGQLEYTGFDVRGTIMFPATRYWQFEPANCIVTLSGYHPFDDYIPLNFSRAEDGGGQLLNADGYTMFLFPGFDIGPEFSQPIFNYSRGEHASGPDPDSTINPFRLFTNDLDRRMFLPNESISRVYHIAPPAGEFVFGYVVDASWVPPTNTPVTDPKTDFPFYANCEDGYILKSEQTTPFKLGTYDKDPDTEYPYPYPFLKVTFLAHPELYVNSLRSFLICPDLTSDTYLKTHGVGKAYNVSLTPLEPGIYSFNLAMRTIPPWPDGPGPAPGTYDGEPGNYLALVFVQFCDYSTPYTPQLFIMEPLFDFINLEVVPGD